MGEQLYLAALSTVDLPTACERLRVCFGLPAFKADVESEGDDWWEYAHADGPAVGFNLTRVGHVADPAAWGWMWGAPERANYQVVVRAADSAALAIAESAVADALECAVARYPRSPGAEPGAAADRGLSSDS